MKTMNACVGSQQAERHRRTYFTAELLESHAFILAKPFEHLLVGTAYKVDGVHVVDGKYHALVHHDNKDSFVPISKLYKPPLGRGSYSPERFEISQINHFQQEIHGALSYLAANAIPLTVNDVTYNVANITKLNAPGQQCKADFALLDNHDNIVYYGSLKKAANPRKFNGYGGLTEYASHPAVANHLDRLLPALSSFKPGDTYISLLNPNSSSDIDIQKKSMFGNAAGQDEYTGNNVHGIHHASVQILSNTTHLFLQSELDVYNTNAFSTQDHPCMIWARYCADRQNFGVKNARFTLGPVGSRKGVIVE